jgi:hypothetical protein
MRKWDHEERRPLEKSQLGATQTMRFAVEGLNAGLLQQNALFGALRSTPTDKLRSSGSIGRAGVLVQRTAPTKSASWYAESDSHNKNLVFLWKGLGGGRACGAVRRLRNGFSVEKEVLGGKQLG